MCSAKVLWTFDQVVSGFGTPPFCPKIGRFEGSCQPPQYFSYEGGKGVPVGLKISM